MTQIGVKRPGLTPLNLAPVPWDIPVGEPRPGRCVHDSGRPRRRRPINGRQTSLVWAGCMWRRQALAHECFLRERSSAGRPRFDPAGSRVRPIASAGPRSDRTAPFPMWGAALELPRGTLRIAVAEHAVPLIPPRAAVQVARLAVDRRDVGRQRSGVDERSVGRARVVAATGVCSNERGRTSASQAENAGSSAVASPVPNPGYAVANTSRIGPSGRSA